MHSAKKNLKKIKKQTSPSAMVNALGKDVFFKKTNFFAECLGYGTQTLCRVLHSSKKLKKITS
jgi:hypothetical protein